MSWIGSGTASSGRGVDHRPVPRLRSASSSSSRVVRSRTSGSSDRTTAFVNPGRTSFR